MNFKHPAASDYFSARLKKFPVYLLFMTGSDNFPRLDNIYSVTKLAGDLDGLPFALHIFKLTAVNT